MSTATELLSRALDALVEEAQYHNDIMLRWHDVFLDIRTFLAAEPEAEPVGQRKVFICTNCDCVYEVPVSECDCACGANQFTEAFIVTRPEPARKPMTEEEMRKGSGEWAHLHNIFEEGIRYAEKHHGIGGDDNG